MYDQTNRRPRRTRQEWQSLLEALAASTLDLETFCEQQAINAGRLKFWRRQLKKSQFIELPNITHQPTSEKAWDVELSLGQGVTLRLRTH